MRLGYRERLGHSPFYLAGTIWRSKRRPVKYVRRTVGYGVAFFILIIVLTAIFGNRPTVAPVAHPSPVASVPTHKPTPKPTHAAKASPTPTPTDTGNAGYVPEHHSHVHVCVGHHIRVCS